MHLLTPEDFEPWVGKKVRVNTVPNAIEVTLERIERRPALIGIDVRQPFSLFFDSPAAVVLMDTTYEFDCGKGGPHNIHITQLRPSQTQRHYQAVFS